MARTTTIRLDEQDEDALRAIRQRDGYNSDAEAIRQAVRAYADPQERLKLFEQMDELRQRLTRSPARRPT